MINAPGEREVAMPHQLPRTPAWRLSGSSVGEGRPPVLWDHLPGMAQAPPPKGSSRLVSDHWLRIKCQDETDVSASTPRAPKGRNEISFT